MHHVLKYQLIRGFVFLIPGAGKRSRLLKRIRYFDSMGDHVFFSRASCPPIPN